MKVLRGDHLYGLSGTLRHKMGHEDPVGEGILYPDRRDKVEPEEGEVGKVILVQRFILEMRMDEPESPERFFPERIIRKVGDEDSLGIPDNNVVNFPGSFDEEADLAAYLRGDLSNIAGEFRSYDFILWNPSSINPFERMNLGPFQARYISVDDRYSLTPVIFFFILSHTEVLYNIGRREGLL
jgi:hypothetical protein